MFQSVETELSNLKKNQKRQQKAMNKYKQHERWTRWGAVGILGLILLLVLFAGYATDWLRGVNKDGAYKTATVSPSLDSAKSSDGSGQSNANTSTKTNTGGGTNTTTREVTNNSTTNTSTTTNNTTTNTGGGDSSSQPPSNLISLYANGSAGDNIGDVLSLADNLGIQAECHNDILIQVCTFSQDGFTVTTKNLLGTGIVTGVTKNF